MCGGSLTSSPEGNFTSPGYNGVSNYSRNLNCEWTLSNPNRGNSSIYIHFETFNLESHQDCQFDFLEFRVGEFNQGNTLSFIYISRLMQRLPAMKGVYNGCAICIKDPKECFSYRVIILCCQAEDNNIPCEQWNVSVFANRCCVLMDVSLTCEEIPFCPFMSPVGPTVMAQFQTPLSDAES